MKPAPTTVRGTTTLCTVTDLTPMLADLVARTKAQNGLPATCAPEELAEAATRFEASLDATWAEQVAAAKGELGRGLTAGLTLEGMTIERSGLVVTSRTTFGFDDVRKLKDLAFRPPEAPAADALRPFPSLTVRVEKGELSLETKLPTFPSAARESQEVLSKNRVRLELTLAARVLTHDATEVQGDTLAWDHALARLSDPGLPAPALHVKVALGA